MLSTLYTHWKQFKIVTTKGFDEVATFETNVISYLTSLLVSLCLRSVLHGNLLPVIKAVEVYFVLEYELCSRRML
jgi:hypothetical protein